MTADEYVEAKKAYERKVADVPQAPSCSISLKNSLVAFGTILFVDGRTGDLAIDIGDPHDTGRGYILPRSQIAKVVRFIAETYPQECNLNGNNEQSNDKEVECDGDHCADRRKD